MGFPQSKLHMLVEIQRIPLDSQGYDDTGAYYGIGLPLFFVFSCGPRLERMERAMNIDVLKERLRLAYPKYTINFQVV